MKPIDLSIKMPKIEANYNFNLNAGVNMNANTNLNAGVNVNVQAPKIPTANFSIQMPKVEVKPVTMNLAGTGDFR